VRGTAAAVALAAFIACSASGAELRRGNRYEPASLDPQKIQTHYESAIVLDLFEGLTTYDAAARPVPGVAESWTVSADGRRWTFKLRDGLSWSDGLPLTAADVVFTFRRLLAPKTAAQYAQLMSMVVGATEILTGAAPPERLGVAAPDTRTVTIDLVNPAPYLPELLANAFAGILPRHAVEARGDDWVTPGTMVSNGAFTLAAWAPQDRIELARNPRFREAASVKLDRVIYYPTADLTSALARFRAGELDMQFEFPSAQAEFLKSSLPAETRLSPSLLTYYLAVNGEKATYADVRVRRALSLAIDRDTLVGRVLKSGEGAAYGFVPPGTVGYAPLVIDDATLTPEVRLAEAKRLLAEAGYGPGNPLKVVYSLSATEDVRRTAIAIAAMWKRAGIETELLNREGKVHFASLKSGDFELGFAGWTADFNDAATFLYVLRSGAVNSNYSRYRDDEFDRLMAAADAEPDAARRNEFMRQAEARAIDDQAIIPLYFGVTRNLVSSRVIGFTANPLDFYPSRYLGLQTP
jgi:oligopeptide transport system substrate-binding protein